MPFPARINPTEIGSRALAVVERVGWERWTLSDVAGELGDPDVAVFDVLATGVPLGVDRPLSRALTAAFPWAPPKELAHDQRHFVTWFNCRALYPSS